MFEKGTTMALPSSSSAKCRNISGTILGEKVKWRESRRTRISAKLKHFGGGQKEPGAYTYVICQTYALEKDHISLFCSCGWDDNVRLYELRMKRILGMGQVHTRTRDCFCWARQTWNLEPRVHRAELEQKYLKSKLVFVVLPFSAHFPVFRRPE